MSKYTLLFSLLFSFALFAGERDGVTMPDKMNVAGTELVLNGMTTRKASKMGIKVKVYVGGLYIVKKSTNPAEILKATTPKKVIMHYVFFRAPKKKIRKGWKDAYNDHCGADCATEKKHLKTFNKQSVTMTKNDKMILEFHQDKLIVEVIKKKKKTKIEIPSKKFADIILKAFVNAKTPTFVNPLLGK